MTESFEKDVWTRALQVEQETSAIKIAMLIGLLLHHYHNIDAFLAILAAIKVQEHLVLLSGDFDTSWLIISFVSIIFYLRHYHYRNVNEAMSFSDLAMDGDTAFAAYFCFFLFHMLLILRAGNAVQWPFYCMILLPCYGWTFYLILTAQWQLIIGIQAIFIGLHIDGILTWSWPAIFIPTWCFLVLIAIILPQILNCNSLRANVRTTCSVLFLFLPLIPLSLWLQATESTFSIYTIFLPWLVPIGNSLPMTRVLAMRSLHVPVTSTPGRSHFVEVENDIAGMQQKIREFYTQGDFESALDIAEICRDNVKEHFGTEHPVYASTLNNIALMQKNLSKLTEAIETYEEALRVYKECVGENHASFATTMHNLGGVYRLQSHSLSGMKKVEAMDYALEYFQESLRIRQENLAPDHPDVAVSMTNVGMLHWHTHKKDKGEDMVVEAMERLQKKLGKESVLTALAMNNVGIVYKELGKTKEACDLFKQVTEIRQTKLGLEHMETITAMHNWAEALRACGRDDEATVLQNQILDIVGPVEDEEEPSKNN
ncbi:hypothetical protein THRCLA_08651 [Thraustotheca clavata]|uniref:Kinesin light chain n=1 Tax=Thraustotheca clavata TaxID=74557 RepID=A0A1V9Z3R8_9STRA|nr:hypothetical protein THRCLA_08651 [Thraustotheca clavata]